MVCRAHKSVPPKWHLDRFSHFCTANGRESLYYTKGRPFSPQNCPFAWGYWPPSNTWFLGPLKSTYQMTSRSVQSFLQGSRSWQTHHAIPSVTTGHIYAVLWCGPIINLIVHLWRLSFVSHLRTVVLSLGSMQIQFIQKNLTKLFPIQRLSISKNSPQPYEQVILLTQIN